MAGMLHKNNRCRNSCAVLVIMSALVLFLLPATKLHAQIVTGKLSGSYQVRHNDRRVPNHFRGYIVFLSMNGDHFKPVVSGRAEGCKNREASPLEPLYSWSSRNNVFLSLNGNFIDPEREYKPGDCRTIIGPLKANYEVIAGLPSRPDGKGNPALWFDRRNYPMISMIDGKSFKQASNVISGQWRARADQPINGTLLIDKGIIKADSALPVSGEAAPRTAAGLTKDGKILILIMIEGRLPDVQGITLPALAEILKSYGAWNAVNFDGGGSSTMEYVPPANFPVKETPALYNIVRNAGLDTTPSDSLQFSFQQLDPRLPFASTAVNQVGGKNTVKNRLYRPLNVFWGFRIKK